jgi:hypothetical protein
MTQALVAVASVLALLVAREAGRQEAAAPAAAAVPVRARQSP